MHVPAGCTGLHVGVLAGLHRFQYSSPPGVWGVSPASFSFQQKQSSWSTTLGCSGVFSSSRGLECLESSSLHAGALLRAVASVGAAFCCFAQVSLSLARFAFHFFAHARLYITRAFACLSHARLHAQPSDRHGAVCVFHAVSADGDGAFARRLLVCGRFIFMAAIAAHVKMPCFGRWLLCGVQASLFLAIHPAAR